MSEKPVPVVQVPADQLKELLMAVLAEARKPVTTDAEVRAAEQAAIDRAEMAKTIMAKMQADKDYQEICSHMNSNFTTSCVLVQPSNFEAYLHCQHCQKNVFRDKEPRLFSQLIQATGQVGNVFA